MLTPAVAATGFGQADFAADALDNFDGAGADVAALDDFDGAGADGWGALPLKGWKFKQFTGPYPFTAKIWMGVRGSFASKLLQNFSETNDSLKYILPYVSRTLSH